MASRHTRKVKQLELESTKALVPKNYKKMIDQDLIDELNHLIEDPDYGDQFKEDFLMHNNVLEHNANWSISKYIDAIKYHSLIQIGHSQVDAYCKVYPERLERKIRDGGSKADMGGEASRFNKSQLINKIRAQALVPLHLVNQHNVQLGINTLANVCANGRYDRDRVAAATALLKELKPPETAKLEIDMKVETTDAISELRKATEELALEQLRSIKAGMAVKEIAEMGIIEGEIDE